MAGTVDGEEYIRVKDGYLEIRVKLGAGQMSASGKSRVLASSRGNVVAEGKVNDEPVMVGFNAYVKA